jgi:hypothetical protein
MQILRNWSPDHPKEVPEKLYQSMRHFDYETELETVSLCGWLLLGFFHVI